MQARCICTCITLKSLHEFFASCLHMQVHRACKHDANKFKSSHASKHSTDTCKHMLGIDQPLLLVWIHLFKHLAALGAALGSCTIWACICKCICKNRTGACICTCITPKSLHDFLAWYLHHASTVLVQSSTVFVLCLHGSCMHMQVPCKSEKPPLTAVV